MPDLDELGSFYLGRRHDLAADQTLAEPVLYDSTDLTTHAVCVGMTGSGKTGLCLALLEEAALDGIPAIVIDPKGDLSNLLLTFPALRPEDFRPDVAASWREGLASWGEDGARIAKFRDSCEVVVYTPGSSAGVQLSLLATFA